ncbi:MULTISPECIES: hypothetical protein [unclassified Geodermatophilus]
MLKRHARTLVVMTACLAPLVAACSGAEVTPPSASGATTTATQDSSTSTAPTSTSTSTSSSQTTTSPSLTPTGGVLEPESSGEELGLEDFFQPNEAHWQENRFDIADQPDVQGMAAVASGCGSNYTRTLELRLSNSFENLTFKVGQSNDSESSDQELTVEVLANNEQVEIRQVPFNQIQEFEIPVRAVNALKVQTYLNPDNPDCRGSVIGVVHDVSVS